MRSKNRYHFPHYLFITATLALIPAKSAAQQDIDLDRCLRKYPDNSVIVGKRKLDVLIEFVKGKPVLTFKDYKEYIALSDNASYFADSKEYFSSKFEMKNFEAYSEVPVKGQYKRIYVKDYAKTAETGSSSFYDDEYSYGFTFPSVVKGCRMITTSRTVTDDPYTPVRFYFGYYFPAENSNLTITCPEAVDITWKLFGRDTSMVKYSMTRKGGKKIFSWQAVESKSYVRDILAPDIDYFVPHIVLQIARYQYKDTETRVIGSLMDLYRWNYSKISSVDRQIAPEIIMLTDSITKGCSTNSDVVKQIFSWVQRNIKYIGIEDGENGYVPREAILVLKRRYGDCKDKASLLVAMLRAQNLPASFGWVGTRSLPYRYSEFATTYNDNHMLAVWWRGDNDPVILDGTTHYNLLDDIPAFIQGKECLIDQGPQKYYLYQIPVAPPEKNTTYDSLVIELKGDTITGTGYTLFQGEKRADILWYFEGKDTSELPRILSRQMPKASNKFIIKSVDPGSMSGTEGPYSLTYTFLLPDYLTLSNAVAYMNLNLDRFPAEVNLREDRWMPLESEFTHRHVFVCSMKIPEKYEIRNIPGDAGYNDPLFGFQQHYSLNNGVITLKTIVYADFQVIEGDDLARFREMLALLNSNYLKSIPMYKITEP